MVYELRRGPGPRTFDPEAEARYHGEVEEAKAKRNVIQIRNGQRLRELARINEPARIAKSQVGLSLRVLREFNNTRFPQPTQPSLYRRMSGAAPLDMSKDPLEAFADSWVANIGNTKRNPVAESLRSLRRDRIERTLRDPDQERRKHKEKVRQRYL